MSSTDPNRTEPVDPAGTSGGATGPTDAPTQTPSPRDRPRRRPVLRGRRGVIAGVAVAAVVAGAAVGATPAAQAAGARAEARTASLDADPTVQRRLDALVEDPGLPGAEAVVRGAKGRGHDYVAGVGDVRTKEAPPTDGRVRIGSNTKPFTAVVVLQLVGEGKIDLDAPVETYLPGLLRGDGIDGTRTTVRQVLQQTSGLPDYLPVVAEDGLVSIQHDYLEPRTLLDAALTRPAEFAPGARWGYSNTNYLVAGLIVQAVTKRPVGEEITRRVIDRAGLEDTYWPAAGVQSIRAPHARGYVVPEPGAAPVDLTTLDPSAGWAAGQIVSTPRDLDTFFRELLAGDLLEPAQLAEMETTVPAPGFEPQQDDWSYGLGIARRTLGCGVVAWGHGGDVQGFESRNLVAEDGRSAAVVVNALPTGTEQIEAVDSFVEDSICG